MASTSLVAQLLRDRIAGVLGLGCYLLVYFILLGAGMWYIAAAAFGTAVNFVFSFYLFKYWVFQNRDSDWKRQMGGYLVMTIAVALLNMLMLFIFADKFGMNEKLAQGASTVILSLGSFFVRRRIFKVASQPEP